MEYNTNRKYKNKFQTTRQWKISPSTAPNGTKTKITSFRLLRTSFLHQTKEFFNNSTLHGVRYIAETDRPFGERLMWFCFTVIGFISALVIIVSLWEKFQTNPTITGLDMDVQQQQLVFPTIAVCPFESYDINRTMDFAYYKLGNYEEESREVFEPFLIYLPQLSYETLNTAVEQSGNITSSPKYRKIVDSRPLRSHSFQVSIFCNETFSTCKYRDEEIRCCDHFHPVYSEHGLCFAFNPRFIDEINTENLNNKFHELFETDKKWALVFAPKREAKIFVHSHLENFGWDFRPHVNWEPSFTVELLISMKQTYTTDDARQLSTGQRKCYFPDEFTLEFYRDEYTFTSCMKECRIRKCIEFCGCLPPFYGSIQNLKYCKIKELKCIADHVANITSIQGCERCELSCANTVYEIEKLTKTNLETNAEKTVSIEYLTWPIIRYKREVLFGWVDLLVSFGGIAGLFLGFSLLSGVEIIYYFTLRTGCMLYKNRQELYEIEQKKLSTPQEHIDLSLKLMQRSSPTSARNDYDATQPAVLRIDVAEISSRIDRNISRNDYDIHEFTKHATRTAKNVQVIRNLRQTETSYDFAKKPGPYYMP